MTTFDPTRASALALTSLSTAVALYSTRRIISSFSNSGLKAAFVSSSYWAVLAAMTSSIAYDLGSYLKWEEPKKSLERLAIATEECIEGYFDISTDPNYMRLVEPLERHIICHSFYLSLGCYFSYLNCLRVESQSSCRFILDKDPAFFSLSNTIHQSWEEASKRYKSVAGECQHLSEKAEAKLQVEFLPGLYVQANAHLICGYPFMAFFAQKQCSAYTQMSFKRRRITSINDTIPKTLTHLRDSFKNFRLIHCAGMKSVLKHYNVSNFDQVYANMSSLSLKPNDKNFFQAQ